MQKDNICNHPHLSISLPFRPVHSPIFRNFSHNLGLISHSLSLFNPLPTQRYLLPEQLSYTLLPYLFASSYRLGLNRRYNFHDRKLFCHFGHTSSKILVSDMHAIIKPLIVAKNRQEQPFILRRTG